MPHYFILPTHKRVLYNDQTALPLPSRLLM